MNAQPKTVAGIGDENRKSEIDPIGVCPLIRLNGVRGMIRSDLRRAERALAYRGRYVDGPILLP